MHKRNIRKDIKLTNEGTINIKNLNRDFILIPIIKTNYRDIILYNKIENLIYGTITISKTKNGFQVGGVAAEKGYGPLLYDAAMTNVYPMGLRPSSDGDIRGEAMNIWDYYYTKRDDVIKKSITKDKVEFNFNILGWDDEFLDEEEKINHYNDLRDEEKKYVDIFNCYYFYNNNELIDLMKIGRNFILKNQSLGSSIRNKSEDFFSMKYV